MKSAPPYHHGALREALLAAAERLLRRDGLAALSLRATAREAGVSHAAPAHHFEDLSGLLSELAAVGFERFTEVMRTPNPAAASYHDGYHSYVTFALENTALFLLMFRSERLDVNRPVLREAHAKAFSQLLKSRGELRRTPTLAQLGAITATWSLAHGFAMLLIDGRLQPILELAPARTDAKALLDAILASQPRAAAPKRRALPETRALPNPKARPRRRRL